MSTSSETLSERKAAIVAQLTELRRQRVAAVLDGEEFNDSGEIAQLSADLEIVDEALTEATKREEEAWRRELAEMEAARVQRLRDELSAEEEKRLVDVARAQAASLELVDALSGVLASSDRMQSIAQQLGFNDLPRGAYGPNVQHRLGERLARVLASLPRNPKQFGEVTWQWQQVRPDEDWAEEERRALAREIETIFRQLDRVNEPAEEPAGGFEEGMAEAAE